MSLRHVFTKITNVAETHVAIIVCANIRFVFSVGHEMREQFADAHFSLAAPNMGTLE